MVGIVVLLFWFSMIFKNKHRDETLLLDFKEISMASKIFIVAAFGLSIWAIGINDFWKGTISIDTFVAFWDSEWFPIGICAVSGFILLENICHRAFFIIKNEKVRKCLYFGVAILLVGTVIYDLFYL